ncbi:MAG: 50S ribosomal protein L17 [Rhodothermia bacterium]|nr:50S ribosomal protein L17 [Rhodothermia bacterium]
MRHQRKRHRLGRTAPHRKATLAALSSALIQHKRITTTAPKAKALREFVEPIITRAKEDTTHNRRQVFRYLQDNDAVSELFGEVAEKVGDRPGGYTRIIKLGQRHGDAAPMAVIELVDYNDVRPEGAAGGRKKTRRGRSRKSKAATAATSAASAAAAVAEDVAGSVDDAVETVIEEAAEVVEKAEEVAEQVVESVQDQVEDVTDVVKDKVEDVAEAVEDTAEEVADIDDSEQADDAESEEPKK